MKYTEGDTVQFTVRNSSTHHGVIQGTDADHYRVSSFDEPNTQFFITDKDISRQLNHGVPQLVVEAMELILRTTKRPVFGKGGHVLTDWNYIKKNHGVSGHRILSYISHNAETYRRYLVHVASLIKS